MSDFSTAGYIPSEKLVKWVIAFIVLQAIAAITGMVSGYLEYSALYDFAHADFESEEAVKALADSNALRQFVVVIVQATIYIIAAVLVLVWIHRANYNAHQLGASNMTFTPAMSVIWFFVPIMGLWKPYQAMLQLWMASHEPANWRSAESHPIVMTWWVLWLGTIAIWFFSLFMASIAHDNSSASLASIVEILSDLTTLLSTLALFVLVRGINRAQLKAVESANND